MYKVTLLLLLSIFLTAAKNCSETSSYKLYLTPDDPDGKKFIEDGWKKLVEYNRVDGAVNYNHSGLFKAQVRVEDNQRKYTILAYYVSENRDVKFSYCYLFVYPIREKPLFIDCYSTGPDGLLFRALRHVGGLLPRSDWWIALIFISGVDLSHTDNRRDHTRHNTLK
ncbi:uncharacterized protein LOC123263616 isoform X1 [Cotesia glomerata]|uniref:uncharacterized protein LOC123263616 isoform X1 n=1 Tax=Cotesia glomerata TaxID=32391 RepID=UPI001D004BDE|nr:uncharacterized protein LOC123263616 isoform X1 [Cotesia glomerata]